MLKIRMLDYIGDTGVSSNRVSPVIRHELEDHVQYVWRKILNVPRRAFMKNLEHPFEDVLANLDFQGVHYSVSETRW